MEQLGKFQSVLSPFNFSPGTHKLSDTFLRTSKICRSSVMKNSPCFSLFFFSEVESFIKFYVLIVIKIQDWSLGEMMVLRI